MMYDNCIDLLQKCPFPTGYIVIAVVWEFWRLDWLFSNLGNEVQISSVTPNLLIQIMWDYIINKLHWTYDI